MDKLTTNSQADRRSGHVPPSNTHPLDRLLAAAILASQWTPLRARGTYSNLRVDQQRTASGIDKAAAEAADHVRFFKYFPGRDVADLLVGKTVLDFGSGYGGRTVEYAQRYGARAVCGTEPVEAHIEASRAFAASRGATNVQFALCSQNDIPYADRSFDVILTFDVLEHVADPRVSLRELRRVLKPQGSLCAVFPLYRGMFAHHLDFITLLPALHLVFGPERIVRVVNQLLATRFQSVDVRYDSPRPSYCRDEVVLPTLNGMGLRDFLRDASMFEADYLRQNSIGDILFGPQTIAAKVLRPLMKLPPMASEILTYNVAAILRPKDP